MKQKYFYFVLGECLSWIIKKAEHWRIDAFELWCWRVLFRVPQTARKVKLVILKGNQPWIFFGRINVEVEAPILWPPDEKSWLIRKDLDAGKDWRQKEKGATGDEIVGWHFQLNRHESEQTPGDSEAGEPCMLQSMGWQRVRQDWLTDWTTATGRTWALKRDITCPLLPRRGKTWGFNVRFSDSKNWLLLLLHFLPL